MLLQQRKTICHFPWNALSYLQDYPVSKMSNDDVLGMERGFRCLWHWSYRHCRESTGLGTLLVGWGNGLVCAAGCVPRGDVNWTRDHIGVWRKSISWIHCSDGGSGGWCPWQRPGGMEGILILAIWAPICAGWTGRVGVSYSHWARALVKSAIVNR